MKKIFLLLAMIMSVSAMAQKKEKFDPAPSAKDMGAALPAMRIVDTALQVYTNDSLENGEYLFLFLFNPSCGHCIDMGKLMVANREQLNSTKVVFLAGAMMLPYMSTFYQATQVGKCTEFVVGVDSAEVVNELYNYVALPQLNIYDKERKLVKTFNGDVTMRALKPYIKD